MITPRLSWFPVRLIAPVHEGRLSPSAWIATARSLGFEAVELHAAFVSGAQARSDVADALQRAGLTVPMLTGACDLVDADRWQDEAAAMRELIDIAAAMSIPTARATAGPDHAGVEFDQVLPRVAERLAELGAYGTRRGVTVCVENHFRDRTWAPGAVDITAPPAHFARLLDALRDSDVRVNYDSAQPMVTGAEGLSLLDDVIDRIAHVHLGDRRRGERAHTILGKGDVDFDGVLDRLHAHGYDHYLTIEDGNPDGAAGLRRGAAFVRELVSARWGAP